MATTISYKDVVNFFEEASPDMAELVMGIIEDNMSKREARRKKITENLKKARAARGTGVGQAAPVGDTQQAQAPARRPGRPARVEDPNQALSQASGQ